MAAAVETSDAASIALLRRLRAGEEFHFIHHADVCSAAPEELTADLQPVPGTEGYSSVWYFFCPKKYKNTKGKTSGHRQRAIVGGGTCWHSEFRAKAVAGFDDGATFCNLSYGRKMNGGHFDRMGWCMVEYDDGSTDDNHVLCKIYRSSSSLAKGKSKSSSTAGTTTSSTSKSKRKAAADHHRDAWPAKLAHHEQYNTASFTNGDYREQSQYVDPELGNFVDTQYGALRSDVAHLTFDELIGGGVQTSGGGEEQQNGLEQDNGGVPEQVIGEHIQMQAAPAVTMPAASAPLPPDDNLFAGMDPDQLYGDTPLPGPELLAQMPPPDADFFDGVEPAAEHMFGVGAQEEQETTQQQQQQEPIYDYTSSWSSSAQTFPMTIWTTQQQPSAAAGLFQFRTPSWFVQGPTY